MAAAEFSSFVCRNGSERETLRPMGIGITAPRWRHLVGCGAFSNAKHHGRISFEQHELVKGWWQWVISADPNWFYARNCDFDRRFCICWTRHHSRDTWPTLCRWETSRRATSGGGNRGCFAVFTSKLHPARQARVCLVSTDRRICCIIFHRVSFLCPNLLFD